LVLAFTSCSDIQKGKDNAVVSDQQNSIDSNTAAVTSLPSFSVQDIEGNIVNLQALKGKKVFVNLWASWCPPCKREMPSIEKLYQSIDNEKVKFILISFDDQFDNAKKYVLSKKLKLPIYYPTENPPALFNVQGIPATFIFNENGELLKRIDGSENYDTREYKTLLQ
jgi:thiol-disulfide isomerase/thioredoxin